MSDHLQTQEDPARQEELERHYERGILDAILAMLRAVRQYGLREGICCTARSAHNIQPDNLLALDTLKAMQLPTDLDLDGLAEMVRECFGRQLIIASHRLDETEENKKLKHLAEVITQLTSPL